MEENVQLDNINMGVETISLWLGEPLEPRYGNSDDCKDHQALPNSWGGFTTRCCEPA